mmetsp:Transcript_47990/g.120127  ORF Transcript_47990/g.120127 Transcript_47990/m.120127 type:complete len:287 (+) Transcript_47990:1651-2511(+)
MIVTHGAAVGVENTRDVGGAVHDAVHLDMSLVAKDTRRLRAAAVGAEVQHSESPQPGRWVALVIESHGDAPIEVHLLYWVHHARGSDGERPPAFGWSAQEMRRILHRVAANVVDCPSSQLLEARAAVLRGEEAEVAVDGRHAADGTLRNDLVDLLKCRKVTCPETFSQEALVVPRDLHHLFHLLDCHAKRLLADDIATVAQQLTHHVLVLGVDQPHIAHVHSERPVPRQLIIAAVCLPDAEAFGECLGLGQLSCGHGNGLGIVHKLEGRTEIRTDVARSYDGPSNL